MNSRLIKGVLTVTALSFAGLSQADTSVIVEVSGIDKETGKLFLNVFESKKAWLKKPMLSDSVVVDGDSATFEVQLSPGQYAFHVFHDVDDDGKMKSNFIGIPKEPTAVSNDAKGRFGPPKFKDAAVTIGDEAVTVPMNLVSID
ncbi:MAG: DUF2141 domain-containing protein [Woeseiaceae bacterium]|nr:DUF2141 domain-containing protein [Woeseiaceae bacterium]